MVLESARAAPLELALLRPLKLQSTISDSVTTPAIAPAKSASRSEIPQGMLQDQRVESTLFVAAISWDQPSKLRVAGSIPAAPTKCIPIRFVMPRFDV